MMTGFTDLSWFKKIFQTVFAKRKTQRQQGAPRTDAQMGVSSEEATVVRNFEEQFQLRFTDHQLIATALKHRSYLNISNESRTYSNERLEFLGDAVLDLVVTHFLYQKFPTKTEGHLSKVKSVLVSKPVMADIAADKMALGNLILMNRGEEKTGGRQRKSIIADAFEAIIGAIYLDMGLDTASEFIHQYLLSDLKKILRKGLYKNYKSMLLEHAQSIGQGLPEYRVLAENGPDHAKEFVISVAIGKEILGEGKGKSKKIAEQEAAKHAVRMLALEEKL